MKNHLVLFMVIMATNKIFAVPLASEKFSKSTQIFWNLEVIRDGKTESFSEIALDDLNENGLANDKLKLSCKFKLIRELFPYDPKTVSYHRNEERVSTNCELDGNLISLNDVICAKSFAKNKVGSIYSDRVEFGVKKNSADMKFKLTCSVK